MSWILFAKKGVWYVPIHPLGWGMVALCIITIVGLFITIDQQSHSVSDTLIGVVPFSIPIAGVFLWIASRGSREMSKQFTDEELRKRLTPEQYQVTQRCNTEPPFSGKYVYEHSPGIYCCVVCGSHLFSSHTKYDSKSGWPSFWQHVENAIEQRRDSSGDMERTEVVCKRCGAHLGHVFNDGPDPTGLRYCINSSALQLHR